MKVSKVHAAVVAAFAGVGGAVLQPAAQAQQGLEEIVVTATRRSEDLQEVPISIVAITGEGLQTRGIQNVENLNATVPNLSVMGQAGGLGTSATSFRVRGIPNVGTFVDGIWQISTNGLLTEEFVDLERVEVLRGPQGTLFGRDSVGGALRIFTKRPEDEFSGTFKGTLGTYDRHDATVTANLPFSENVKSKWTYADSNRNGYITSRETGLKGGNIDQTHVRGDIVWEASDNLDFRGLISRQESSYIEPRVQDAVWISSGFNPTATAALLYTNAGLPYDQNSQMAGWPGGTVGKWENRSAITIPNNLRTDQASLDIRYDISDKLSVNFLTGYTDQLAKIFVDYDNSQYVLVEDTSNQNNRMFSQEIQFAGGGDRLQWVAGAFYWDESRRTRGVRYAMQEFTADPTTRSDNQRALDLYATPYCQNLVTLAAAGALPPGATTCQAGMTQYKTNSTLDRFGGVGGNLTENGTSGIALFGEVTLSLTDKFTLVLGARQHDQDNYSQTMTPTNAAPRYSNQEFSADPLAGLMNLERTPSSFDKMTGRVSARYQFTDDIMGYVSFAQGFNSGNAIFVANPETGQRDLYPTRPEVLDNFEVGVRTDLADGRVRFNATLFDATWDDIVVSTALRFCDSTGFCRDLTAVVPQNVGSAHARGAEFEVAYLPTSNLMLNFNLGLLSTGYDKITVPSVVAYVPGQTEFSQAPERTYNIGIQHDASLGNGGTFTTRFDYTYVSQYWRSPDPTLRVAYYAAAGGGIPPGFSDESGDFGQINARLTYAPADERWDFSVFGTNLTNEYQLNSGFFHGVWGYDFATVARPRELGASLQFHF